MELDANLLEDADDGIGVVWQRLPRLLSNAPANDEREKGVFVFVADSDPLFVRELEGLPLDSLLNVGFIFAIYEGDCEEARV